MLSQQTLPTLFLCFALVSPVAAAQQGQRSPAAPPPQVPTHERAQQLLRQGLVEQAVNLFNQLLERDPADIKALLGLAQAQQRAGRTGPAIIAYEKVLRLEPGQPTALRELGRLYSYQEVTWLPAIAVLQEYLQKQAGDVDARLLLASVLSWRGQHEDAVLQARQILQQHPGHPRASLLLAQVLTWQGRGREALPLFQTLIQHKALPRTARPDYASALRQDGQLAAAERLFRSLSREQPGNQKYRTILAELANERRALASGGAGTTPYSKDQQALLTQARRLQREQQTEAALPLYRQVVTQRPGDTRLLLEFVDVLASVPSHRPEAVTLLEQAAQRKPAQSLQLTRARILSWMPERRREALNLYREFYRQQPSSKEIRQQLIQTLIWSESDPALLPLFQELLQREPGHAALRLRLAQVLVEQQDYQAALNQLEILLQADPENYDARLTLANAYFKLGRVAESEAQLQRVLKAVAPAPAR